MLSMEIRSCACDLLPGGLGDAGPERFGTAGSCLFSISQNFPSEGTAGAFSPRETAMGEGAGV
jgi:hypothetical protein